MGKKLFTSLLTTNKQFLLATNYLPSGQSVCVCLSHNQMVLLSMAQSTTTAMAFCIPSNASIHFGPPYLTFLFPEGSKLNQHCVCTAPLLHL